MKPIDQLPKKLQEEIRKAEKEDGFRYGAAFHEFDGR